MTKDPVYLLANRMSPEADISTRCHLHRAQPFAFNRRALGHCHLHRLYQSTSVHTISKHLEGIETMSADGAWTCFVSQCKGG